MENEDIKIIRALMRELEKKMHNLDLRIDKIESTLKIPRELKLENIYSET